MSTMSYIWLVIPLLLVIFIVIKFLRLKSGLNSSSEIAISDVSSKDKKFSMSYEEALEASKQFIYDIIKAVMQKFSPDDVKTLLQLGKNLAVKGVKYMHVVDVQALQYQKFVRAKQQPGQVAGR